MNTVLFKVKITQYGDELESELRKPAKQVLLTAYYNTKTRAMKRQNDRDTPPKTKRNRSSYSSYEGKSRNRGSPELDRRDGRNPGPGLSAKHNSLSMRDSKKFHNRNYDHEYDRIPSRQVDERMLDNVYARNERTPEFRTLCISNLHFQVADAGIKDGLYREFKRFGEFNIKIVHNNDNRIAYINFRHPEDARSAKNARSKLILFDRPVRIEAVFNKRNENRHSLSPDGRDLYVNRSLSPGQNRNGRRSMSNRNDGRVDMSDKEREFNNYDNHNQNRRGPNERFPHHLLHVLPEDDDKANRTLFVGNLDPNTTDADLRHVFEKFGSVEDIDIKRQRSGQGNAYAFVKFINLDVAHKAKVEMSGKYIGKFQCKIGYGKATPSTCLWVGGLGPWIRTETLEREFDRFGVIHRIEWPHGKNYAYVLYDNIDAAQAAIQDMRGFPLGGPEKRLRVDFADVNHIAPEGAENWPGDNREMAYRDAHFNQDSNAAGHEHGSFNEHWPAGRGHNNSRSGRNENSDSVGSYKNPDNPTKMYENDRQQRSGDVGERRKRRSPADDRTDERGLYRHSSRTPSDCHSYSPRDRDPSGDHGNNASAHHLSPNIKRRCHSYDSDDRSSHSDPHMLDVEIERRTSGGHKCPLVVEHVNNILDLAKCLPVVWNGALVLKNSAFPARMHLISGDVSVVDSLMRDPKTDMPYLRITQRLRLDVPKLEEVGRRISSSGSGSHSILLAMPGNIQNNDDPVSKTQQRPLRNLVTYLKQKEAAGVISLPPCAPSKDADNVGVLHAFPPCQFGCEYLLNRAPKLDTETSKDDYLVIVVVRGAV